MNKGLGNTLVFPLTFPEVKLSAVKWLFHTQPPPPQWNSPCQGEGAYPPRSSNQSASMRKAQLNIAAKAIRPTYLLNNNVAVHLFVAVHLVTVCLCASAGWLPRLAKRKVAMLHAFTIDF